MCIRDSSWPFSRVHEIQPHAGTTRTWATVNGWLDECRAGHQRCVSSVSSTWYPKRLLRLAPSSPGQEGRIRLIYTDNDRPSSAYVALSHCWGGKSGLVNTVTSESGLLQGVQWNELPNTFRDAITVVRNIRMEYLWIDSLCIQQDNRADWAQHAQCMDKVFQHAQLTIAATTSANSSECFLHSGEEGPLIVTRSRMRLLWRDVSL